MSHFQLFPALIYRSELNAIISFCEKKFSSGCLRRAGIKPGLEGQGSSQVGRLSAPNMFAALRCSLPGGVPRGSDALGSHYGSLRTWKSVSILAYVLFQGFYACASGGFKLDGSSKPPQYISFLPRALNESCDKYLCSPYREGFSVLWRPLFSDIRKQ